MNDCVNKKTKLEDFTPVNPENPGESLYKGMSKIAILTKIVYKLFELMSCKK